MKRIKYLLFIIILFFIGSNFVHALDNKVTPVEAHGNLSVEGINIVDKNGNPFQLRGVSSHGIGLTSYYHKYINQDSLNFMRDNWGINTVRLARYTPNNDADYLSYLNREELIKNDIDYAIKAGLYVIVDWHVLKPGDPNEHKDEAIEFFKYYANLYKDYPNIIYEIANEPHDVDWNNELKTYSEEVINEIRKIDDDAIIIVGTSGYSHGIDEALENPIEGDNLVYSYHFYAATNKDKYRERLVNTVEKGLPVIISECGMIKADAKGNVDFDSANEWMKILDKYKIGYMVWQLTNKDEAASLIKNDVTKLSDWEYDELTEHGKWFFDHLKTYPNDNMLITNIYNIIEGENQEHIKDKDSDVIFKIDANYKFFKNGGKIYIDNNLLNSDNYTSESGSTIIKLKKEYIDTLDVGNHTIKVLFNNDGYANSSFSVIKSEIKEEEQIKTIENNKNEEIINPTTNDNIVMHLILFNLSLLIMILLKRKINSNI